MTAPHSPDDWRGAAPGRQHPQSSAQPRSWRKSQAPLPGKPIAWSRWLAAGTTGLALLICVYWIINLFWFLGRRTTELLVLATPEYLSDGMPFNSQAFGDLAAVQALQNVAGPRQQFHVRQIEQFSEIENHPHADVLLIYINMIGGSDSQGTFVFPRDAQPDDVERRIRLETLWNVLKSLPPQQQKLLLLDVQRIPVNWRLGLLASSVWDEIQTQVKEVPNLAVLTACSPGEQSWTSVDLGQSVFGESLCRGLAGGADTNRDRNITLGELATFVCANTNNWVFNNRDELQGQHPRIYPAEIATNAKPSASILLRVKSAPSAKPSLEVSGSPELLSKLRQLWSDRDRILQTEAPRHSPLVWKQLQTLLLRAEGALDAGQPQRSEELLQLAASVMSSLDTAKQPLTAEIEKFPFLRANLLQRIHPPKSDDQTAISHEARIPMPEQVLQDQLKQLTIDFPVRSAIPPNVAAQGAQLRQVVEKICAQSGSLLAWVRPLIDTGETYARLAEDQMFAQTCDVEQIQSGLQQAEKNYSDAIEHAKIVETAQDTLSRMMLQLPALAEWAAGITGNDAAQMQLLQMAAEQSALLTHPDMAVPSFAVTHAGGRPTDLDRLPADVLALFAQVRRLKHIVENPTTIAERVSDLQQSVTAINMEWNRIHSILINEAMELRQVQPESPQPIHQRRFAELLRYFLLPADLRYDLRQQLRNAEQVMAYRTEPARNLEASLVLTDDLAGRNTAFHDGAWQSLWALNVLSLEPPAGWTELVRNWSEAVQGNTPERQNRQLLALGEPLRSAWADLRRQCSEMAQRDAPDFSAHEPLLLTSYHTAHIVDGFDSLVLAPMVDPARRLRQWQLENLAFYLCDRHLQGFWTSLSDQQRPWYEEVAAETLALVERVNREARFHAEDELKHRRQLLNDLRSARLQVNLPVTDRIRFHLSRNRYPVDVGLKDDTQRLPEGMATVWLLGPHLESISIDGNGSQVKTTAESCHFQLQPAQPASTPANCDPLKLRPLAFFRGHRWAAAKELVVDPCRKPGRLFHYVAHADSGTIVVEGHDERNIMFLLDCSLSMADPVPGGGSSKFDVALSNLEGIIAAMSPDDRLGLAVFAHRVAYDSNAPGQRRLNPNWKGAWVDRFGPIPPQMNWDDDFQVLCPVDSLRRNRTEIIDNLHQLKTLGPHGNTPLVGAITYCLSEEVLPALGGTVIAITDGAATDANPRSEARLQTSLKQRRGSCQIVGFGFDVRTDQEAQDLEALKKTAAAVGAAYLNAPGAQELIGEVTKTLQARPFRVSSLLGGNEMSSPLGQAIGPLPMGSYEVLFGDLQPVPVTLAGGERLAFGVSVDEGLLLRKPVDYKIGVPAAQASSLKSAPDYCAYQTFQLNATGQMTLVLVLDAVDSEPVKRSFVRRPDEIEFDVVPAGSLKRLSSTMRLKPDMTVPAWELVYDDWPAGQPAEVRAWWKMERTLPDLLLSWSDISAAYSPEQARSIQLGDQMPELQLMARRPTETQLQIALSSLAAGQLSEDMAQTLDGIRVELGQVDVRGRFQPYELSFTRDFSVADGSLIVEFDLTNKLDLDRSTIALTTLNSRRQSAVQLKKPLTVSRFDSIGVTSQPP